MTSKMLVIWVAALAIHAAVPVLVAAHMETEQRR
jgi:hypothetical protein